jgi:hypothetical protein
MNSRRFVEPHMLKELNVQRPFNISKKMSRMQNSIDAAYRLQSWTDNFYLLFHAYACGLSTDVCTTTHQWR